MSQIAREFHKLGWQNSQVRALAGEARRQAYRSADHLLVVRNWLIGWRIVAQEQNGKERAKYGKHVIELASQTLTEEYGRGFGLTSIKNMRSFYLMFSKLQIGQAILDQFNLTDEPMGVFCFLSLACQQIFDNGIGEAFLLHGVQSLDGATAMSCYLIDGRLYMFACSLKQLYSTLYGLQVHRLQVHSQG